MKRGTLDWEIIDGGDWQAKAKGYTFNLRPDGGFSGSGTAWQLDVQRDGSRRVHEFNCIRSRIQAFAEADRIVEGNTCLR